MGPHEGVALRQLAVRGTLNGAGAVGEGEGRSPPSHVGTPEVVPVLGALGAIGVQSGNLASMKPTSSVTTWQALASTTTSAVWGA